MQNIYRSDELKRYTHFLNNVRYCREDDGARERERACCMVTCLPGAQAGTVNRQWQKGPGGQEDEQMDRIRKDNARSVLFFGNRGEQNLPTYSSL